MPASILSLAGVARGDKRAPDLDLERGADAAQLECCVREQVEQLLAFLTQEAPALTFHAVEQAVLGRLFTLGRLLLALFLSGCHERLDVPEVEVRAGWSYRRRPAQGRVLGTVFGKVKYWRTYLYAPGGGYYPLDRELQLPADGFSLHLSSLMTRLATKLSYAQVTGVLTSFLGWSPCQLTIERTVLGLGRYTTAWFEQAPVPPDDGEVLIIQIDSKATPTATEGELQKRRGKRQPPAVSDSARHRGRTKRRRRGPKKRRQPGDHTKNGRAATVVVMYTLRRGQDAQGAPVLKGPLNRWVYASYAPKRHAFAIARREATRRGFAPACGKTLQLVTDGDPDLACYAQEFFPEAIHTLDIFHVQEYLWEAGRLLFRAERPPLESWVAQQSKRLYAGKIPLVLQDLQRQLAAIPKTGPGTTGKRERLQQILSYLATRKHMMNYAELRTQDLELGSGAVEGAVRYLVAQRFDCAGMRWIRERAEALLQLRAIEVNGHWEEFMTFVQATGRRESGTPWHGLLLQASTPAPLPTFGLAA